MYGQAMTTAVFAGNQPSTILCHSKKHKQAALGGLRMRLRLSVALYFVIKETKV